MSAHALILDFDGLILDTELPGYQAWNEFYGKEGVRLEVSDWLNAVGYVDGFDPRAHLEQLTSRRYDWSVLDAQIANRARELIARAAPLPGVVSLLERGLAAGYRLGVASNSSSDWVLPGLERLGLRKHFGVVRTVDTVARPKPQPDVYLAVLADLGISTPEGSFAFEDSQPGVRAAKAAGLYVVAVPNELTRHQDLSLADEVLPSLAGFGLPARS